MLALHSPREAYRRVELDARVTGSGSGQLVGLCFEQLTEALGRALFAHEHGNNRLKSQSLTRALSALTALQLGVGGDDGVAQALRHFYESGRRILLDNVLDFDAMAIAAVRQDFNDVAGAFAEVEHN